MSKTILVQSNDAKSLPRLVEEKYPDYDVLFRDIIRVEYKAEYKYNQIFRIQKSPSK